MEGIGEPAQQIDLVVVLNATTDITTRQVFRIVCGALFLQETHEAGDQGPETQDSFRTHELVLVTAEQVLCVCEEGLNGLITNDKFCLSRQGELQLTWWRRPLRLREKQG